MSRSREGLPGGWLELSLLPTEKGAGIGPALGWLAGALASGGALWPWPHLGQLLLGLFLTSAVWGRLWTRFGRASYPLPASPSSTSANDPSPLQLPYTTPGSLSAEWSTTLRQAWRRLWTGEEGYGRQWVEAVCLAGLLLLITGLWGRTPFLIGVTGLALLGLRWFARERPVAISLLRVLGGLAWPWWLGHAAWAPLIGASLLLSIIWGLAYAGWADSVERPTAGRPLLQIDLAQTGGILFFLLSGQPIVAGALVFTLLGQVLLQAGLVRAGRWERVPRQTWPFAAAGIILSGLAVGRWL